MTPFRHEPIDDPQAREREDAPRDVGGGRTPAPASALSAWLKLALVAGGVLTMAGAGALAIVVDLPTASAAKWTPLAAAAATGDTWWPAPSASEVTDASPGSLAPTSPPLHARDEQRDSALAESQAPPASGVTADGKVILNLASEVELTRLPGVGKRRAEQIVALRTRLGKFRKLRDLLRVKGIGPRSLKRLAPLVVLDPPPPERDGAAP